MTSQAVRFSRLAFAFNWRCQTPRYGLMVSFHCPGCKVLCKTQLRIVCWYPRMCRTQLRPSEQQWIKQSPANEANTGILQISLWCNLLGSQSQGPQVKACKIILLSSGKNLIRYNRAEKCFLRRLNLQVHRDVKAVLIFIPGARESLCHIQRIKLSTYTNNVKPQ